MGDLGLRMQEQLKQSSVDLLGLTMRMLTGLVLGLTLALVVKEALGFAEGEGQISFYFIIAAVLLTFYKISKSWSVVSVLIFDLVCVLLGMVLRLYVMVAPNI